MDRLIAVWISQDDQKDGEFTDQAPAEKDTIAHNPPG
jgi:hypothetical protein